MSSSLLYFVGVLICQTLIAAWAFYVSTPGLSRIAKVGFAIVVLVGFGLAILSHNADQKEAVREAAEQQKPLLVSMDTIRKEQHSGFATLRKPAPLPPLAAPAQAADVTLRFVHPESPAVLLVNNTSVVASSIKWTVVLWNLDDPRRYSAPMPNDPPDTHEPLQIPSSLFDYVLSHSVGGPENIFATPLVAPYVKPGNRLVGVASVVCPTCTRGHTYFVYITYGQGGWYAELPQFRKGQLPLPTPMTKANVAQQLDAAAQSIAERKQIPIR
jgi:hypothetical protein